MKSTRVAFALTLLLAAGSGHAVEVSMAQGGVHFSVPDGWLGIMETEGDPEARVFQVPDASATGRTALARVTVTVKQVASMAEFSQYQAEASAKALGLPGYQAETVQPAPNTSRYSARENGVTFSYVEHYWFKPGYAIQLRCMRPAQSEAGAAWAGAFDKGCAGIAEQLK